MVVQKGWIVKGYKATLGRNGNVCYPNRFVKHTDLHVPKLVALKNIKCNEIYLYFNEVERSQKVKRDKITFISE